MPAEVAINDVRINEPNRFLQTIPGVTIATTEIGKNELKIQKALPGQKIFILQRPHLQRPASELHLKLLLEAGYLIIVEYDDDPIVFENPKNNFLTFRGVHCIQTSTEALAKRLREINQNVAIFPNQISQLPKIKSQNTTDKISLFFGALNRKNDWLPIIDRLNAIVQRFGNLIHFEVIHDEEFFLRLDTPYKNFQPTCDYIRYKEILNRCQIGLLPLEPTTFNSRKSDLKFIEHAANSVVTLASETVYANSISDNTTGMIYNSPDEFELKLTQLIENPELRQLLINNAYNWVKNNRMHYQHYIDRYKWYLKMLDELPRLNEELRQREPQLFF